MQTADPVMVLLDIAPGASRLHSSRRVFEALKKLDIDVPVIHHKRFAHDYINHEHRIPKMLVRNLAGLQCSKWLL